MENRTRLRRDTAANWTFNNPTLGLGEIGIEVEENTFKALKLKIGSGIDPWNNLEYFNNLESINDISDADTKTILPVDGQALSWNNDLQKWVPGIAIFVQQDEPLEAPENSIWINTSGAE